MNLDALIRMILDIASRDGSLPAVGEAMVTAAAQAGYR